MQTERSLNEGQKRGQWLTSDSDQNRLYLGSPPTVQGACDSQKLLLVIANIFKIGKDHLFSPNDTAPDKP